MRRWRVSSGPTLTSSTRPAHSFPLTSRYLPPFSQSSLSFSFPFLLAPSSHFFILHRVARKRSRLGPITTRPKSYVEFICRRRRRHHELLVEIRPAILHVQIPGLANARTSDGGNILSLFNLAGCASPRARCIRMIFIRVCKRVLMPRACARSRFSFSAVLAEADC